MGLGGPAILQFDNQREDVDTLFDLIESEERGGIILDFSLLDKKLDKLFAKPVIGEQRVQVMTVHKAKGLEFDTVILPQLCRQTQRLERDLLIWTEELDDYGMPQLRIAAVDQSGEEGPDYRRVRDAIKTKEGHELKRLFYVACTRAKNDLFLLASRKIKKDGTCAKAPNGTFLGLIWDSVQAEFETAARRNRSAAPVDTDTKDHPKTILRRLPVGWRLPAFDQSIFWQPGWRKDQASAHEITYEWVRGNARHVGTVVHNLLNWIAIEGLQRWDLNRLRLSRKLVTSELLMLGVARTDEPEATEKVMAAVTNGLTTKRGRWILAGHAESRSEYALRGRIQDRLVTGVIDRMFRDENGRLWIIDYKTGEHAGGNRETFLNEEQRRYREQLENYATLISRLEDGPISLGLYFPLLDSWREWEFAEEAAFIA
jgi:ATP-dependent exoDNAse (exonuclease V) beta subunit